MTRTIIASSLTKPSLKVIKSFKDQCQFKRFNKLIPASISGVNKNRELIVEAVCDCGELIHAPMASIKYGKPKSCGCLKRKHGLTKHPLYSVLRGIVRRTVDPSSKDYKYYGGRGIKLCLEWANFPAEFVEWGLVNGWEKSLQIDRIDNDGDYSPVNCRFVNSKENIHNRRNTRYCDWDGEIISFEDAATRLGKAKYYLHSIEHNSSYHLVPSFVKIIPKLYGS
jgi:hypothetical protein